MKRYINGFKLACTVLIVAVVGSIIYGVPLQWALNNHYDILGVAWAVIFPIGILTLMFSHEEI